MYMHKTIGRRDIEIEYPDKSFITIEYDGNISTGKKIKERGDMVPDRLLTLLANGEYYDLDDNFFTNTGY